jgi:DedD protein
VNIRTKQRMVGGLVMLALLAIFLPMFFSSPHPSTTLTLSQKTPVEPAKPQISLQLPTQPQAAPATPTAQPLMTALSRVPQDPVNVTAPAKKITLKKIALKKAVPHVRSPIKVMAKPKTAHHSAAQSTTPGWVLQLGSFSHTTNATILMNKLKKAGYKVYSHKITHKDGHSLVQVFLGPTPTRATIEKIKVKLHKDYRIKGFVRRSRS